MVEGARLESVYTSKGYQGFESLSLRRYLYQNALKARKSLISGLFYFVETFKTCENEQIISA